MPKLSPRPDQQKGKSLKRYRQPGGLSLAFLDIMSCGLGAIVLVFMLVKFNQDASIPEDDFLRADLARLQATELELRQALADAEARSAETEDAIQAAFGNLKSLKDAVSENVRQNAAKQREAADLRDKLNQAETAHASDAVEKPDAGEETYLIGLKVKGKRIGILIDGSASMTDRKLIDIIHRKNASVRDKRNGPKWRRTVDIVHWLVARLPSESEVSAVAFSENAVQLGKQGWTSARDSTGLKAILRDLKNIEPSGATNLQAGLSAAEELGVTDLYLITDGLPTKGDSGYRSLNPFAGCSALWGQSNTISGECRLKLFEHTLKTAAPGGKMTVNTILLPLEGDPGAAFAFWVWTGITGGLLISPAEGWP